MSQIQSDYDGATFYNAMTDMQDIIRDRWDLINPMDFFAPPLPPQPRYRNDDPWLIRALFLLVKTSRSLGTARDALNVVLARRAQERLDRQADEVSAEDVYEARNDIIENMSRDALRLHEDFAPKLRRDEERWKRQRGYYERDYTDYLRDMKEREGEERDRHRGSRSVPRGNRNDRRRSRMRSPTRYRQRSRSPPRPRDRERRASMIDERPIPPPQPSFQRSRPVEHSANHGATTDHFNEHAIKTPNFEAEPPGATFDEQLELRDEAAQLLGAQEEYYEAVRRKMLSRYMARVQMYEKKVIETRKRVAGGERTRGSRDDEGRGRGRRGHGREIRDGRRR